MHIDVMTMDYSDSGPPSISYQIPDIPGLITDVDDFLPSTITDFDFPSLIIRGVDLSRPKAVSRSVSDNDNPLITVRPITRRSRMP